MSIFLGNIMTAEEKQVLQDKMLEERSNLDTAIIPYLDKINSFNFIQTTFSCMGHFNKNNNTYSEGYVHFRSGLSEKETINVILKPLLEKFPATSEVSLLVYQSNLKYLLGFDGRTSEETLSYLLDRLKKIILDPEYGW